MTFQTALLRGAALGAFVALTVGMTAHAEETTTTTKIVHHKHHVVHMTKVVTTTGSGEEVRALRAEVEQLKARLDSQGQLQQATAAQVAQTQTQVQEAAANAESAQAKIETIPEQVNVAIGQLPKPKNDKIYYKGLAITLGGFLEMTDIERSHNMVSDIATNYSQIPFGNNVAGKNSENRFTEHQSRLSALVQGDAAPDVHLAMYGEFDFNAAAQTANSNETNSYQPRIRHLYATIDYDNFLGENFGLHFLAGQNWSLATMNTKGITPRNELTPPQVDAQYVPGFTFARQPQVRLTGDWLDHTLWAAVSVENPQTNSTAGAVPANTTFGATGQSGFNNQNQVSYNQIPDVIAKAAYELKYADHTLHLEAFGIARNFDDRHGYPLITSIGRINQDVWTGSFGFGAVLQAIPSVLDLQVSGITGKGVGRYTASQLADATFASNGKLDPIAQTSWLIGGTYHALPVLDIYGFVGRDQQDHTATQSVGGVNYGLGNALLDARACPYEVAASAPAGSACNIQTKAIQQETVGFWHKVYQGNFGRVQWGLQYSHTERISFAGVGGVSTSGQEDMIFTSFRYYPF